MSMKKKIIIVGWILLGILFVSLGAMAVIAVLEGQGAQPWKLVRGGRGGTIFPIELLAILAVVVVVGGFWIKRRFFSSVRGSKDAMKGR